MRRFTARLLERRRAGYVPVIPDFKLISPADGLLFSGRDVLQAARDLEAAGAPALSVVTEERDFGGSLDLLSDLVKAVRIPVLRKDFIRTTADVEETARRGAAAVLLICACLDEATLGALYRDAIACGLEPLVEAHTAEELRWARDLGAKLVGINNRDILALEKDGGTVSTTSALAAGRPEGAVLISESGIHSPADVKAALSAGADAVLVGTAIWQAEDPVAFYRELSTAEGKSK